MRVTVVYMIKCRLKEKAMKKFLLLGLLLLIVPAINSASGSLGEHLGQNLLEAVYNEKVDKVQEILAKDKALVNYVSSEGFFAGGDPLTTALIVKNAEIAQILLDAGADPKKYNSVKFMETYKELQPNIYEGHPLSKLLNKYVTGSEGPVTKTKTSLPPRPAWMTSKQTQPEEEAKTAEVDKTAGKEFMDAIFKGRAAKAIALLQANKKLALYINQDGDTMLLLAVKSLPGFELRKLVPLLLEAGVNPEAKDKDGKKADDYVFDSVVENILKKHSLAG